MAIEKYSLTNNSAPIWSRSFQNNFQGNQIDISFIQDYQHSLDTEVLVAGWFAGSVNFDYGLSLTSSVSGASADIFVARYRATDGTGLWAANNVSNSAGGSSSPIAVASNAWYFYVMGLIQYRTIYADFGGCGGTSQIIADNASNGYVARYKIILQRLNVYSLTASSGGLNTGFVSANTTQLKGSSTAQWYIDGLLKETTTDPYAYGWDYLGGKCNINHTFSVTVNRVCGSPLSIGQSYFQPPCSGGGALTIAAFPNPAASTFTVQLQSADNFESQSLPVTEDFEVKLFNNLQSPVRIGKSMNGKLEMDVADLPIGIYYLWVYRGNVILRSHIQVLN